MPVLRLSSDSAAGKNAIAASIASSQVRGACIFDCLANFIWIKKKR